MSKRQNNKPATDKSAEAPVTPQAPAAKPVAEKPSAKRALRALFPTVNTEHSAAEVFKCGTKVAVQTALSDLKNAKYARGDTISIVRVGTGDAATYKRIA